jgi:hypothetical protein
MPPRLLARAALAAVFVSFAAGAQAAAPANPYDGDWHTSLTPYVWLAGSTTKLNFVNPVNGANVSASATQTATQTLGKLHFALMGINEVRKGEWTAFGDVLYASIGSSSAKVRTVTGPNGLVEIPVNVDTKDSLQQLILTLGVGRSIYHDDGSFADAFAGVRYGAIKAKLDFSLAGPLNLLPKSGRLENADHTWDAIVGVKGRYMFDRGPWFFLYYGDVGSGRSNLTGQVYAGPGYALDWGDLFVTFRYLHLDTGANSRHIRQLDMYGPMIGGTIYLDGLF